MGGLGTTDHTATMQVSSEERYHFSNQNATNALKDLTGLEKQRSNSKALRQFLTLEQTFRSFLASHCWVLQYKPGLGLTKISYAQINLKGPECVRCMLKFLLGA